MTNIFSGTCLCTNGWNGKHCTLEGCPANCNGSDHQDGAGVYFTLAMINSRHGMIDYDLFQNFENTPYMQTSQATGPARCRPTGWPGNASVRPAGMDLAAIFSSNRNATTRLTMTEVRFDDEIFGCQHYDSAYAQAQCGI